MKHRNYKKHLTKRQNTLFKPRYKVIYKDNTFCGSYRTQEANKQYQMKPTKFMSYTSVVINPKYNSLIDSTVRDQGLPHDIDHLLKDLVKLTKSYNSN